MSGIFISYRREDSAPYAGRLYDRLCAYFGAGQVFMDVDDIPPGANFLAQIEAKVASCDAIVAVIGKSWLTARNVQGQLRLSDPGDFVAMEIASALQRNILVIPTLVGGGTMPDRKDLPHELRDLAQRNAVTLNDQDFHRDTDQLIQALEKIPGLLGGSSEVSLKARDARRISTRRGRIWTAPLALLLVMAGLWWQWYQGDKQLQGGDVSREVKSSAAAAISGRWTGDVTYGWGPTYTEQFLFHAEGDKLFGTASFLAFKRGIEEGQLSGDRISFSVRFQEALGETTIERRNRYTGTLSGGQIHFRMQDDKGSPPVEFIVKKDGQIG